MTTDRDAAAAAYAEPLILHRENINRAAAVETAFRSGWDAGWDAAMESLKQHDGDPNNDVLTWLDSADMATREQAVRMCQRAAEEIRRIRSQPPSSTGEGA